MNGALKTKIRTITSLPNIAPCKGCICRLLWCHQQTSLLPGGSTDVLILWQEGTSFVGEKGKEKDTVPLRPSFPIWCLQMSWADGRCRVIQNIWRHQDREGYSKANSLPPYDFSWVIYNRAKVNYGNKLFIKDEGHTPNLVHVALKYSKAVLLSLFTVWVTWYSA